MRHPVPYLSTQQSSPMPNKPGTLASEQSNGSPVNGLVTHDAPVPTPREQSTPVSFLKDTPKESGGVLLPSIANPSPERMLVIPAGGLGKASSRKSPRPGRASRSTSRTNSTTAGPGGSPTKSVAPTPTREVDRLLVENRAPTRFICPISGRIMRDPIILASGTCCDRVSFERWLAKGNRVDPVSKRPLRKPIHLAPNLELRQQITAWAHTHARWLLDKDGMLEVKEAPLSELQGKDPQYVTITVEDPNDSRTIFNKEFGERQKWSFMEKATSKSSKKSKSSTGINLVAHAGGADLTVVPWAPHQGIASATVARRKKRNSSRSSGERSSQPTVPKRDWIPAIFLLAVAATYLALFLASVAKNSWSMAPMYVNPWFGVPAEALAAVGAQALPLMEGPDHGWWRLFTSPFVPAGLIHLLIALAGLWIYGWYAKKTLRLPKASVPAIYFLSSWLGSLVSANLNTSFLTCGAMTGVAGYFGVLLADQVLNGRKKKLFNLREWYLVAGILIVNLGLLVTMSLLPMVDIWGTIAAIVAGFLTAMAILLIPRSRRDMPGFAAWGCLQITCVVLLVIAYILAIVGVALPTKVGANSTSLRQASCSSFGNSWWQCIQYGYLPSGCGLNTVGGPGALTLTCPSTAVPMPLPADIQYSPSNTTGIQDLCSYYCPVWNPASEPSYAPSVNSVIVPPAAGPSRAPAPVVNAVLIPVPSNFVLPSSTIPISSNSFAAPTVPGVTTTVLPTTVQTTTSQTTGVQTASPAIGANSVGRKLRAGSSIR